MKLSRNRRGMTLPLTLLMILMLSVIVAAGFNRVSAERRVNGDMNAQVDAYAVAQSGLEQYAANVTSAPPAVVTDSVTGLAGGKAYINMWLLKAAAGGNPATYVIVSRGVNTAAPRFDPRTPPAERTVATYAQWQTASLGTSAAWTSITGLHKNGNSGSLSGTDNCGAASAVAGVAVPSSPGVTGNSNPISGSPPVSTLGADAAAAAAAVPINWNGIINQSLITPNVTITSGTTGWPTSAQWSNPNYYPTIIVKTGTSANFSLPSDGRGLLIVQGDLTISGNTTWKGAILVGGNLTSNGNNTVLGSVVTGLNVKLGLPVPAADVGNGNKTFQYDSCELAKAMSGLSTFVTLRNGMVDNWPTY